MAALIAAINFDRSGTARIGRFVLNHSFMLPGLVATGTAVTVGLVIARHLFRPQDEKKEETMSVTTEFRIEKDFLGERQVPVDPTQGGAGTSIDMNTNEVLANRTLEILGAPKGSYKVISPNTHVNMVQSTNDAFPTGVHIATLDLLKEMLGELGNLRDAFAAREKEFGGTIKMGRTHLQDAVPIRLGQVFGAYRRVLDRDIRRITGIGLHLLRMRSGTWSRGTSGKTSMN